MSTIAASSPETFQPDERVVRLGASARTAQLRRRNEALPRVLQARIPQQEPDCCHGLHEEHLSRLGAAHLPHQRGGGGQGQRRRHLAGDGE
ncbi:hypothetical protein [Streptomyces sp. NPDC018833]|uniref:hypothetical protein n=1 Tax=Streptomyces sp. NPDC018833 TaxID=3365053 RepID=UPI00378AF098